MNKLTTVLTMVKKDLIIGSIDLTDAYYLVPVALEHYK